MQTSCTTADLMQSNLRIVERSALNTLKMSYRFGFAWRIGVSPV